MQEVAKVLQDKGYVVQPKEDIGMMKLTKEIAEEPEVRHVIKNWREIQSLTYRNEGGSPRTRASILGTFHTVVEKEIRVESNIVGIFDKFIIYFFLRLYKW
ncbi:hypothetical protein [Bacillus cereus]|uniref:hypothetical protein n=1 Tax=Bacillus cereus TaxID=1396 RepID=UPI000BECF205|nr:hypothetical protein [Bacillus cereus]PEA01900.1 hypothetical protein CON37_25355 [Bacillus cereus]